MPKPSTVIPRGPPSIPRNWNLATVKICLRRRLSAWKGWQVRGSLTYTNHVLSLAFPSRKRHQDEAKVWLNAPRTESLVPLNNRRRLKWDITRATTETIATWVTRQNQLRKRIRNKKTTSIITNFISEAELQNNDRVFHNKLIEARRGIRHRSEPITLNEEPPD